MMKILSTVMRLLAAGMLITHAASVGAQQAYPSKPVTFVVPFGPGTGNDVIARIVAQKVSENWIQPVVVENRVGASGGIAMQITAKSPPDGYTVVIASTSHILNQFVSKVRYDIVKDFAPVSLTSSLPYVLAVTSSSPANSGGDIGRQFIDNASRGTGRRKDPVPQDHIDASTAWSRTSPSG